MKRFFVLFILILIFLLSCDLSNLFPPGKESIAFEKIQASVRPVYRKAAHQEYNKQRWLDFEEEDHDWYLYSDEYFNREVEFTSNLEIEDIKNNFKLWFSGRFSPIREVNLIMDDQLTGAETANPSDYPDRFSGRTFKQSMDWIEDFISKADAVNSVIITYVLGESMIIPLSDSTIRNHYIMSQKRVVHVVYTWILSFVAVLESVNPMPRKGPYVFHMKDKITLTYTAMDIYYPQNILVFDEIILVLKDKATLIRLYPSNMIESHRIDGKTITLTMVDHDDLETVQVGHLLRALIRVEDGTIKTIIFSIIS